MPLVKFDRVVSCSSEDPNHPAKNLLKTETYKKWKCKSPGEDQISVVLQLEKSSLISSIDIGNEHSAFVEVLVGRSSGDAEDFKVLLVASSFMTPLEARSDDNPNRVRMFSVDQLSKPTVSERWDRVKVVCRQPFNRHVQYGLSFLKLHTSAEEVSNQPAAKNEQQHQTKLGRFVVREEELDDDDIKVGSLFAFKHGATVGGGLLGGPHKPPPSTGAAAIMDASKPAALARMDQSKKKQNPVPRKNMEIPNAQRLDTPIKTAIKDNQRESKDSKQAHGNGIVNSHTSTDRTKDEDDMEHRPSSKKIKLKDDSHYVAAASMPKNQIKEASTDGDNRQPAADQKAGPSNARKKPRAEVPFSKLLNKVVLVISGYQNPLRANLRQAALDMGAKYRPDWGPGCTHLMCAFPNTPKFNQVKGHGKIVRKEWIEDCHSQRKRLPWRRYAMDKKDQVGPESDTEDESDSAASASEGKNSHPASPSNLDDSGYVRMSISQTDVKKRPSLFAPLPDGKEKRTPTQNRHMPATSCHSPDSYYDADTDVDEDADLPSDGDLPPLPQLPNFFRGIKFRLGPSLSEDTSSKLERYITAYGGETVDVVGKADYLLTDKIKDCEKIKFDRNKCAAVRPAWVWECSDNKKLVPATNFELE